MRVWRIAQLAPREWAMCVTEGMIVADLVARPAQLVLLHVARMGVSHCVNHIRAIAPAALPPIITTAFCRVPHVIL